jgi:hypothetical protein
MNNQANTFIICTHICFTVALLAVGVFVMQPAEVSAATFQARPDGDVTTNWSVTGSTCGGGHYCTLNENVTTSGTGDLSDNVNTGSQNDLDRWTMTSPSKVDTATSLTAHVYTDATSNRSLSNNMQVQISLYINGSQVGSTYSCSNSTGSATWCTASTITGTFSQADIDSLEMEIESKKNGGGPADTLRVAAAYVDVEYSKTQSFSFEQSSYRLFENQDSTAVGSALASENSSTTLAAPGNDFRVRQLLHVNSSQLGTSGQDFKLQFAQKGGGTCSSPGGSYSDVTSNTAIAYLDNPTPADGDALTATSADPTHNSDVTNDQTYEEANNFTNSQSAIGAGEDGLWDFSLTDNGATQGNTYCLRAVQSDGTTLSTYLNYPQVTIPQRNFNHSAFRFFANKDSTEVGSALASQDNNITLSSDGESFRLRSLFHVSGVDLATSSKDFQLQFATEVTATLPAVRISATTTIQHQLTAML